MTAIKTLIETPIKTIAAALVLATSLPALAADEAPVKDISVTTELSAVTNEAAAAYWASLDTDLKTAIATRVADRIGDTGAVITIDIEEVSLSNGFTEKLGLADTRIVGDIMVQDDDDVRRNQYYTLTIDVNRATPMMPEGTDVATLPADTRVYYTAMVDAFAENVVENLR
ncbi:MAG: hypothetical protein WAT09_10695 [Paracoccaceae bacterium]